MQMDDEYKKSGLRSQQQQQDHHHSNTPTHQLIYNTTVHLNHIYIIYNIYIIHNIYIIMCHYLESTCTKCRRNAIYAVKLIMICNIARIRGGAECPYVRGLVEVYPAFGVCPRHSLISPPPTPPPQQQQQQHI
ncbi:hypothetical protein F503_06867 [Ophiostoma piceae UAMH 11346]|uniref:Uncharacterized protein n=1 Tax=Ophiostoma piceae (strain UAMH 11346) TaxID=1262450 RepID=S3CAY4_OPHP1|nr:hypothetical protein F503_06867 [Ophiostoma piceae UAMH 11346]